MIPDVALDRMTVAEKLALMERIWDDLSRRPQDVSSPAWHGDVLADRMRVVREGRAEFVDWDEAKKRLRHRRSPDLPGGGLRDLESAFTAAAKPDPNT